MSYANGTTHYNLPQTVGTDKRDWFDTNQAFSDLDAAVYGVVEQSGTDHGDIAAIKSTIADLQGADIQFQSDLNNTNGRVSTLEQNAVTDEAAIDDLADMFCPLEVATAQSDIDVAQGRMFRYNDVLYVATTAIAIGDTIVPNTNCVATNMEEELSQINTALSDVVIMQSRSSSSITVGANTSESFSVDITPPTGYKFLTVANAYTSGSTKLLLNVRTDNISSNTISGYARNVEATSETTPVVLDVLFIRNI